MQRAILLPALFVFVAVTVQLTSGRGAVELDSSFLWQAAKQWVEYGEPAVEWGKSPLIHTRADGRRFSPYPLGVTMTMVPSYLALRAICPSMHNDPAHAFWEVFLLKAPNSALAGLLAVFAFVLFRQLHVSRWLATVLALSAVFATNCAFYYRLSYAEGLQATALCGTVAAAMAFRHRPAAWKAVLVGLAWGWLLQSKILFVVVAPLVCVYMLVPASRAPEVTSPPRDAARARYRHRLLAFLGVLPPALGSIGLALWFNHLRYGEWLALGYGAGGYGFTNSMAVGLYGLLLAPGKSVFLYSPILILGLFGATRMFRSHRAESLLLAAILCATIPLFAKWWAWSGDWAWGPRFLVPLVPLMMMPAALALSPGTGWSPRLGLLVRAVVGPALLVAGLAVASLGNWVQCWWYIGAANDALTVTPSPRDDLAHLHFLPEWQPIVAHAWIAWYVATGRTPLARRTPWARMYNDIPPYDLTHLQRMELDYWVTDHVAPRSADAARPETSSTAAALAIALGVMALASAGAVGFGVGRSYRHYPARVRRAPRQPRTST